jgi:SHS2 domain-containing protein
VTAYFSPQPFVELDHTADAGVAVEGDSAEQALARLVLALGQTLSGGRAVEQARTIEVRVEPADYAMMAVDVLRELLFVFDSERLIPSACRVDEIDPHGGVRVAVTVGAYDPDRHDEGLDLKAVTLHEARFEHLNGRWQAQVLFDV